MTSPTNNRAVDAKSTTLADLLREGRFEVPWHQRYYDWSREHVEDLLEDLDEAISSGADCYFLDSIKLAGNKGGLWQVNDGQQRLVTFSLICARLTRSFSETGDGRREGYGMRLLFDLRESHNESLDSSDNLTPRIIPPRNDKGNYNLLIRGNEVGANGNLTTAWGIIDAHFQKKNPDQLNAFFDFIGEKLEVVRIDISERIDPNSVFETLNARGKRLSDLDLIRNYFYSFFSESADENRRNTVHGNLEDMRQMLREERSENRSSEYMRCYLQGQFGFLPSDRLYREMKARIRGKVDDNAALSGSDYVFELVRDLTRRDKIGVFEALSKPSENAEVFAAFHRDMPTLWKRRKRSVFALMNDLRAYSVARPVTFALLNAYMEAPNGQPRKDAAKLVYNRLHLFTSFVMRTAFVARKFEPSRYQREFANLAQRITTDGAASLSAIEFQSALRELDDHRVLDDAAFVQELSQAAITRGSNTKAKRLLLGIAYSQQSDLEVVNDRKCTLEHILPQSESYWEGWSGFADGEHETWVDRIGNLTLLSEADNKPGGGFNKSFERKKEAFFDSAILLTRNIANAEVWTPDEVRSRQERLANIAAKVWDLPSDVA